MRPKQNSLENPACVRQAKLGNTVKVLQPNHEWKFKATENTTQHVRWLKKSRKTLNHLQRLIKAC